MDNGPGLLQALNLQTGEVTSCDLNPNYLLAIGSSDRIVRVLEWKRGLGFVDVSYSPLQHHKHGITSVRFSPKGTMLASSSLDGTAVLFSVSTGSIIFTMVQHNTTSIRWCQFTCDSTKLITAGDDGVFCFWDLVRRTQLSHCRLHEDEFCVRSAAVSSDSEYLLSADSGNFLKLWSIADCRPRCISLRKNVHEGIFSCDFSSAVEVTGGSVIKYRYVIATGGADCLTKLWAVVIQRDEAPGKSLVCEMTLLQDLEGHANDVLSVRFNSAGDYLVSTGLDSVIKLWEVPGGSCVETLRGHRSFGTCSVFSEDSVLLVTGSNDRTVIVWDMTQRLTLDSRLLIPCNASSHFTSIDVINYANKSVTGDEGKEVTTQFSVVQKLASSSVINSVHMQGDILAIAGGDKSVAIWKRRGNTYEATECVENHRYGINHLEISPCGHRVISSSKDGVIVFWDLNMKLTHEMRVPGFGNSLRTCRFSPNSKFVASAGDDQKVFLWDTNNLEFSKIVQHHDNAVTSVAFTPDGQFLVSACCGGDVKLYSFDRGKTVCVINNAHDLGTMCCDFSPAGGANKRRESPQGSSSTETERDVRENYLLATCGNDSLVKVWEVRNSEILISRHLFGHSGVVNHVRFSPSQPLILASCASDATIRIWHVGAKQCLHVLNQHQSAVTTCSFSRDPSLFATGSLDKSVLIWQMTRQFCSEPLDASKNSNKILQDWTVADIAEWFLDIGCPDIATKVHSLQLDGVKLLSTNDALILDEIGSESEKECKALQRNLHWLRKESTLYSFDRLPVTGDIPHGFLCPITHKVMKNPVICSDGYIYDRGAITEWFLTGALTSPMTREYLTTTKLLPYSALKKNIHEFLYMNENNN